MRRLDLHPRRRLRNPGRHLRALEHWPKRIVADLPTAVDLAGRRFWSFKVPVFAKLVEPPHATPETQRACLSALFAAAHAIEGSSCRPPNCRVAVLATTPFLFQSEVTLFSDEAYFETFRPVQTTRRTDYADGWVETAPADPARLLAILPPAPAGLAFLGGTQLVEVDREWGPAPVERVNWVWTFSRH